MDNEILKGKSLSTRGAILDGALKLINEIGMSDFRIELLSQALKISPGNITYHFSKKEDICIALWSEFMMRIKITTSSLSRMLDVRQTYLLFRTLSRELYDYRGVVMYRGGDLRIIKNDESSTDSSYTKFICKITKEIENVLHMNGYIKNIPFDESRKYRNYNFVLLTRFSINFDMLVSVNKNFSESRIIDRNALTMLHSFFSVLTDKGVKEFKSIADIVYKDEMSIKKDEII